MRLSTPGLATRLKDHATLVTSSTVQAAVASQQFARSELARGHLSWRRPAVYSLDTWLSACWQEARYASPELPSLLSPAQELLVWESIIENSPTDLFDVPATARLAREALRLTIEWELPFPATAPDPWTTHQDAQQFHRWQSAFRLRCRTNRWMTRNDVMQLYPSWIESNLCTQPAATIFAGFHNPSPLLQTIIQIAGTLLPTAADEDNAPTHNHPVHPCPDLRAELEHAARWARARFESDPRHTIGIFVPDLAEHRTRIDRVFQNVFYPRAAMQLLADDHHPLDQDAPPIYHINRAQSLFEHPLVANALLFLELARPRIESSAATAILRSPFLHGAPKERDSRAIADLALRRLRELDVSLRDMENATRSCPALTLTWTRVREVIRSKPDQADVAVWSRFFGDLVQSAGWPGDIELTAPEQRLVEGWKDSLSSLATLGLVSPSLNFDAAVRRLRQILGAGGIQSGDWYSPIQILDANDAASLHFDSAFLLGLSEQTWPPSLRMSPLIPPQLQRAYRLPNSTPALLQSERLRLTQALFRVAPTVAATFTERLSPLVSPSVQVISEPVPERWNGKVPLESFAPATLNEIDDSQAPPLDLTARAAGGTGVIKSQSLCPFRAFAEYRLASQSPEDSCFGFDARDRGGFLHKALQYVWQQLKDSDTLKKYPQPALEELIRDSVLRAVTANPNSEFHAQTALVERERLENLLLEWLTDVEKQRKQSFTVEQVENELQYNLAGLSLRLRVDRIDRLRGGGLLLIDYKSGKVTKNKLDCPRPSEPQLLVYASAKHPHVEGLLFGAVRARESRLVGKTRDRHMAGGSTAVLGNDWDDFIQQAEDEVSRLAAQFVAGNALVDPSKGACDFCANKPLCRVKEMPGQSEEEA